MNATTKTFDRKLLMKCKQSWNERKWKKKKDKMKVKLRAFNKIQWRNEIELRQK